LDQRLAVERENTRLKGALEDQKKLREMLQRALNTRVARRVRRERAGCQFFYIFINFIGIYLVGDGDHDHAGDEDQAVAHGAA
jgi:hypothetical protein